MTIPPEHTDIKTVITNAIARALSDVKMFEPSTALEDVKFIYESMLFNEAFEAAEYNDQKAALLAGISHKAFLTAKKKYNIEDPDEIQSALDFGSAIDFGNDRGMS